MRIYSSSLSQTLIKYIRFLPQIYALIILMGAPLTTHIPETILLSVLIGNLAFLPVLNEHILNISNWNDLFSPFWNRMPLKSRCYGVFYGTLLGAYVGAIPIPLDWDREWQKWPVTIIVGAIMGSVIGRMGQWTWDEINYLRMQ